MATIVRDFPVDAPADVVWKEFADVGGVNRLIDYLGEVTVNGNVRTCSMGEAGELEELIVSIDDERRRLAYSVQQSPFGLQHHHASVQILDEGSGSRCIWTTDLLPDHMAGMIVEPVDAAVASIQRFFSAVPA